MPESSALARISAYVAENKIMVVLEAKYQQMMVVEATDSGSAQTNQYGHSGQTTALESRRLDCIYDDESLGFGSGQQPRPWKCKHMILYKR